MKLERPVKLVKPGDKYGTRFPAGAECPAELEDQAREKGGFEPMEDDDGRVSQRGARDRASERIAGATPGKRDRSDAGSPTKPKPKAAKSETAAARKKRETAERKAKAEADKAAAKDEGW